MMQEIEFELESKPAKSFLAQKAANSLDIDVKKKLKHHFSVKADITSEFNVGLIYGASGAGKTTLIKHLFGEDCLKQVLDLKKPLVDQFPKDWEYKQISKALLGVGLSSVTCWIRPAVTLSNGQRFRAEVALQIAKGISPIIIDEWTSVVDRTVGKAMSQSIQKFARKTNSQVILCSCHEDVFEWLNPCWVINCNTQSYADRRSLWRGYKRKEKLKFTINECPRDTWKQFSKYHYLSDKLPGGHIETFGLFLGDKQIGFQCFANYVPHRKNTKRQMHSNRTVIHPDYVGFGMGVELINITSAHMTKKGFKVMARFSSLPVYRAFMKYPDKWKFLKASKNLGKTQVGGTMDRKSGFREFVQTYNFKWIGGDKVQDKVMA